MARTRGHYRQRRTHRGTEPVEMDGRRFYGYLARGVPEPDDGTLSPWTAITSLPFAPEIALPAIRHYLASYPQLLGEYGLRCSLNPSWRGEAGEAAGWFSGHYYGINEGPVVLMIENYRSGFLWELMKRSPISSRDCSVPAFVGAGWGRADSGRPWAASSRPPWPGACGVATMRLGEDVMEVEGGAAPSRPFLSN